MCLKQPSIGIITVTLLLILSTTIFEGVVLADSSAWEALRGGNCGWLEPYFRGGGGGGGGPVLFPKH